jgi:hypothetical protein
MKKTLFGAALLATTAFGLVHGSPGFAESKPVVKDSFTTKAAAEKRAGELKCAGVHGSGTAWKPCKDAASYEKALKMAPKK